MQRVWAVVLSVWAMLAIVAFLAWSHGPVTSSATQPAARTLVVKGANGKQQLVVLQPGTAVAPHATTSTSGVVKP